MGAEGALGTVAATIETWLEIAPSPTALKATSLKMYNAPSVKSETDFEVEYYVTAWRLLSSSEFAAPDPLFQ